MKHYFFKIGTLDDIIITVFNPFPCDNLRLDVFSDFD